MLLVVKRHCLVDEQLGLGPVVGQDNEEFIFHYVIDPFGQRVLVTVVAVGHQATQLVLVQGHLIGIRGVLATAVGIMDGADWVRAGPAVPCNRWCAGSMTRLRYIVP